MTLQLLSLEQQGFEVGSPAASFPTLVNCAIAQTAAQAHDGTKSMSLTSTAGGDMSATTPTIAVMPGRSYNFSSWYRSAVSARTCNTLLNWYMSDGATPSLIRASDTVTSGADSTSAWTQTAVGAVVAPSDAYFVTMTVQVKATGAGAEVHYVDTNTLLDMGSPYFKHGRTAQIFMGSLDVSGFFHSVAWAAKVATADTSVFQNTWKQYIAGQGESTLICSGFYDSTLTGIRSTFQQVPPIPAITYIPSSTPAIGDPVRLIAANTTDYKEGSKVGGAVTMDWTVQASTIPIWGTVLHVLQSETGTITGVGDPLGNTSGATTTGAIAHLHVTALSGGTLSFKLQDSVTLNGAYTDIASGAFTNITAVGYQRLVIPGTIRAFVHAVATLGGNTCTYAIAAART